MSWEDILQRGEREIDELLHRDRRAGQSQTPAPGPVTLAAATTTEAPSMFDLNEIKTGLADIGAKIGEIDSDAEAKARAIKATPEGAELFETVTSLASYAAKSVLPASVLTSLLGSVKSIAVIVQPWIDRFEQEQAQQAAGAPSAPAGPQIAGQA